MKKVVYTIVGLVIVCSLCLNATLNLVFGQESERGELLLHSNVIKAAKVYNVTEKGDNLTDANKDSNCFILDDKSIMITYLSIKDNMLKISGNVENRDFCIKGHLSGISENGNVLAFNAKDESNSFRVVFCAIEKNIEYSSLYFKTFSKENNEYDVVTKLYLAIPGNKGNYIMIEIFGNKFPKISEESIKSLPQDHYLNLYWYAKEFKPIYAGKASNIVSDIDNDKSYVKDTNKSFYSNLENFKIFKPENVSDENIVSPMAGNASYGLLEMFTFNHLGMQIRHFLRHWHDCDIRDVTLNQTSSASATIRVTNKWIEAPNPNDSSSTNSALSLKDVSIVYLTRKNTAVNTTKASGSVSQNGYTLTNFNIDLGVGLKSLGATASISFSWMPGYDNRPTGVHHELDTNYPGSYWREAECKLRSNQSLKNIGNNYVAHWTYSSYGDAPTTGVASIVFKYYVYNNLEYMESYSDSDTYSFSVNITQ